MSERSSFVVVANRLPVDEEETSDGREWRRSPGGLVSALHPVLASHRGTWVGWPGGVHDPTVHDPTALRAAVPDEVDGIRMHPVPLTATEIEDFYEGHCNSTIWPLYHDAVEQPRFRRRWREAYRRVNARFAEAAAEAAAPGATVWVHDYQLQLVPGLLRATRPDLRIGFFLHVPFPPMELFMQIPMRAEILRGLLGADLVGFQQPLAVQNFLRIARHLLGLRTRGDALRLDGRRVRVGSFPISIDVASMEAMSTDPSTLERAKQIRADLGDPATVMLGVDRLDYTKGIGQRLQAFRELLADNTIAVPQTVMVQVATPSRERVEHYQELRIKVEREVGRINGDYSQVGLPAVHYLHQSYSPSELAALYRAADVMLVTPLRDGMNLVAKEYVAARADNGGAVVLSEFAGAAYELRQAFLCNPHDVDALKDAIVRAATVDPADGSRRMSAMRRYLRTHDVNRWADSFLRMLADPQATDPQATEPTATHPPGSDVPLVDAARLPDASPAADARQ